MRRPALAGLTEQDMVSLYSIAPIRTVPAGAALVRAGDVRPHLVIVVDGALEVRWSRNGQELALATIGRGQCLDAAGEGPSPHTVVAREVTTLLELQPAALEMVPAATQLALARTAAAASTTRFQALAERHAALATRGDELAAYARALEERTRACLASPALGEIIAGIPRLPLYAMDLAGKLLDERTHADEVVESIKNNPSLAGLVLKRVNSAAYARPAPIADYYHAFLLLGTNTVYQLVLESGVEAVLPDTAEAREVQDHSHLVSVLARELALLAGGVPPLVLSTIGLLHDVGRTAALLLRETRPEIAGFVDLLEPAAFGGAVLASWGLPDRVVRVIDRQRQPEFLPPDRLDDTFRRETAVLHLAHACDAWLAGGDMRAPYATEYMTLLGLRDRSPVDLFRDGLVPAARKNHDALPAAIRGVLAL